MFQNQSGRYLFKSQILSIGDAYSEWFVLHRQSIEQEEDLVIVQIWCAPSAGKLIEEVLQFQDKI